MAGPAPASVNRLLEELGAGDASAAAQLAPLVYGELRALAGGYLRNERAGHTLQATALVHEAYLRLVDQSRARYNDRAHFLASAATVMRRILVDHARARATAKRGGGNVERLTVTEAVWSENREEIDVLSIHEALEALAAIDERRARVVELRFFGGLSVEEAALVLGVSARTVKDDWRFARAWLCERLAGEGTT